MSRWTCIYQGRPDDISNGVMQRLPGARSTAASGLESYGKSNDYRVVLVNDRGSLLHVQEGHNWQHLYREVKEYAETKMQGYL